MTISVPSHATRVPLPRAVLVPPRGRLTGTGAGGHSPRAGAAPLKGIPGVAGGKPVWPSETSSSTATPGSSPETKRSRTSRTPRFAGLIEDLKQTCWAAPGLGLAAPQIGVNLRIAIVDLSVGKDASQVLVLVNPVVVDSAGVDPGRGGVPVPSGLRRDRGASREGHDRGVRRARDRNAPSTGATSSPGRSATRSIISISACSWTGSRPSRRGFSCGRSRSARNRVPGRSGTGLRPQLVEDLHAAEGAPEVSREVEQVLELVRGARRRRRTAPVDPEGADELAAREEGRRGHGPLVLAARRRAAGHARSAGPRRERAPRRRRARAPRARSWTRRRSARRRPGGARAASRRRLRRRRRSGPGRARSGGARMSATEIPSSSRREAISCSSSRIAARAVRASTSCLTRRAFLTRALSSRAEKGFVT